jgi:tetratricopeptide (TPR) repeat protein
MATKEIGYTDVGELSDVYRLTLLGSFSLRRPDGSLVGGLGRKARALVAFVAIAEGPVDRLVLSKMLWSDRGQEQARASLRQTFYELRQQLPAIPPLLIVDRDSVSISRRFLAMDIEPWEPASHEIEGQTLLRDLDHLDPRFDRWLLDERSRLTRAAEPGEVALAAITASVDAPRNRGCRVGHISASPASPHLTKRLLAAAAAGLAVVFACLLALYPHGHGTMSRLVSVQSLLTARGDAPARTLSDGLAMAVEREVVGTATPVRIVDLQTSTSNPPALVLRGNATSRDGRLRANLELVDADGAVIWSGSFDRPPAEASAMIDQLGLQIARELHFAFANGRNDIFDRDLEAIRLSLAAGEAVGRDFGEAARYSTVILTREPRFARGWAELAIDTLEAAEDLPERARTRAERSATADAQHALAIDPHQGLAYFAIAESHHGLAQWKKREQIVTLGLKADRNSPELNVTRADDLAAIGRLQEAVGYARRAYDLDHFMPGKVAVLAGMEMDVGNLQAARDLIKRGRRMWPDQHWPDTLALTLAMYWGDPAEARALLDASKLPSRRASREADIAFLSWRRTGTPTAAAAAAHAIEAVAHHSGATPELIQQLAALGRIDEAYRLADALPVATDADSHWYRNYLGSFRADPRFMAFAARQGIASVWRNTGSWPDFCADKTLPYSCDRIYGLA